jgi:hypothetical protein
MRPRPMQYTSPIAELQENFHLRILSSVALQFHASLLPVTPPGLLKNRRKSKHNSHNKLRDKLLLFKIIVSLRQKTSNNQKKNV